MITFLVGILGNIIAAYVFDILRRKDAQAPPIVLIIQPQRLPSNYATSSSLEDARLFRREELRRTCMFLLFFALTILVLFAGIQIPVGLNLEPEIGMSLADIKLFNQFSEAQYSARSLFTFNTILTSALYLPLLLAGDRILVSLKNWYDAYWPVTFEAWLIMRGLIFSSLALFISGIVTYLVSDLTLLKALIYPFAIFAVLTISIIGRGG